MPKKKSKKRSKSKTSRAPERSKAPARKHRVLGGASVNIEDGDAPASTHIQADEIVTFNNYDDVDYLIELWDKSNTVCIPLCPFLPKGGSFEFQADPNVQNGTCYFNILDTTVTPVRRVESGTHSIIIGTGAN